MITRLTLLLLTTVLLAQRPGGNGPPHSGDGTDGGDGTTTPGRTHGGDSPDLETQYTKINEELNAAQTGTPAGSHTRPSRQPDPNATPGGTPADAHPTRVSDRQLRLENESANILAQNGYDITQNPQGRPNGRNPDYHMEGDYWDCLSPTSNNVDQVRKGISKKVMDSNGNIQADKIILNISDTNVTPDALRNRLNSKPIEGLKEIKIIDGNGHIIDFWP